MKKTFLIKTIVTVVLCASSVFSYAASYSRVIGPSGNRSLEQMDPVTINNEQDVLIRNVKIQNPDGECIKVIGSANVTIVDSVIGPCGTYSSSNDQNRGFGVFVYESDNVKVLRNSFIDNFIGAVAIGSTKIKIDQNRFSGVGKHMAQFNRVNGPGNSISYNIGTAILGNSITEDMINVFESNGVPNGYIRVTHNRLQSGGNSTSGSGIMVGDNGGSYQLVARNRLVNTGHVGIGVASGTNITVQDNLLYQSQQPIKDSGGMFVFEQYGKPCNNVIVRRNIVDWTQDNGYQYGFYEDGSCEFTESQNEFEGSLSTDIFWQ